MFGTVMWSVPWVKGVQVNVLEVPAKFCSPSRLGSCIPSTETVIWPGGTNPEKFPDESVVDVVSIESSEFAVLMFHPIIGWALTSSTWPENDTGELVKAKFTVLGDVVTLTV